MGAAQIATLALLLCLPYLSESCGTQIFDIARVLETDNPGIVLGNMTAEENITWTKKLDIIDLPTPSNPLQLNGMRAWLEDAVIINRSLGSDNHSIVLHKVLDLEFFFTRWGVKLSNLRYLLTCKTEGQPETTYEFFVSITAVNEFAPEFIGAPFNVSISEDAWTETFVMRLRDNATDKDVVTSSESDIHEFSMRSTTDKDWFKMDDKQNGEIRVGHELNFEAFDSAESAFLEYNITVWDTGRWNSTSTITIYILDADDQDPVFFYPGCTPPVCVIDTYTCEVTYNFTGLVTNTMPAAIMARDNDTLGYNVTYSLKAGPQNPSFRNYLTIDPQTGVLSVLKRLEVYQGRQIVLTVTATEVSEKRHSNDIPMIVTVTYPNTYVTTTFKTGASTEDKSSADTVVIAVVVLSVFVLLAFLGMGALLVYIKKRPDKPIYPADFLEDEKVIEGEDDDAKRGGSSNTDSGQWSMNGVPSPSHHAGSTAPSHTIIPVNAEQQQHNGQVLVNGHVVANGQVPPAQFRKARGASAKGGRRSMSARSEVSSSGEARSRLSIADIHPQEDSQAEEETVQQIYQQQNAQNMMMAHENMQQSAILNGNAQNGTGALVHAQMHGNGHVPQHGENGVLHEEEEDEEEDVLNSGVRVISSRRLAPLSAPAGNPRMSAKLPKRSRSSRKERREQKLARLRAEQFDGTKVYPMSADPSFFTEGNKQKVKLSSRKKKNLTLDPRLLMVVDNDYAEI
ncbi:hypothetical protein V1264_011408 [Littorina saxatilis]|uniref:Cadherin domain-containing protein n=2 Tax=Littorina saxatilis TaxID=31220 RepID=A0AAN9GL10_9CAEN